MIDTNGGTQIVDQLRALLDRLGSPDITLAEAKNLREEVLALVAKRGFQASGGRKPPVRIEKTGASRPLALSWNEL